MSVRIFIVAGLAICASQVVRAEPFDLKLGAWEMTYTTETSGGMIPQAALEKMPPAQRAKLEAAMKKHEAAGTRTRTHQSCVTKEDLKRSGFGDPDRKDCTY